MRRRSSLILGIIGLVIVCVVGFISYTSIWYPERFTLDLLNIPPSQWPLSFSSDILPEDIPYFSGSSSSIRADDEKRDAVVAAFKHGWSAYVRDAMGSDEYFSVSRKGRNLTAAGGIGYTIVDAIDTMYLMGLRSEYEVARGWIETSLSFNRYSSGYSTFETTIRVLGGLLSAHYLTSDPLFLERAEDLGHRLIATFNTSSGLPQTSLNLARPGGFQSGGITSPAEAGSLQLELKYLAELTGNETFWHKAEHAIAVIQQTLLPNGLAPTRIKINGTGQRSVVRLGALADSYYEYLLKQYLQTKRTEPVYQRIYNQAIDGIATNLTMHTPRENLTYMSELDPHVVRLPNGKYAQDAYTIGRRQEHLTCFLAGSLLLGAVTSGARNGPRSVSVPPRPHELTERGMRDWKLGIDFLEGCMSTHDTETGLAAEIVEFRGDEIKGEVYPYPRDWFIPSRAPPRAFGKPKPPFEARYQLRPEIVESVFIAWRLTGNTRYRDFSWNVFRAIETHARIPTGGYATVSDVDEVPVQWIDKQETFFLSETLKYLYLTFCDSEVLPLHDIVFNTEAHPLPLFTPTIKSTFF